MGAGPIEIEIEDAGWRDLEPLAEALAIQAADAAVGEADGRAGGIVILLTDDQTLRGLNARFRDNDVPTNVLSFPAAASAEGHLGDIALALGVCVREAGELGWPLCWRLQHLVAHGVLHLMGYDHRDDDEAEAMESLERRIMTRLGAPDPYAAERSLGASPLADEPRGRGRPPRSRGLRALWRRWRRDKSHPPETDTPALEDPASDIVDQAEAFRTLRVGDVMTPRVDIVAVEIGAPFSELLARFIEAEHTRMPIYRETLDDPVGQVHVKDVFRMLADEARRPAPDEPVLRRLRREVLYVPGSMRAADLMVRMQASRMHMALVIDEFGGTDGVVTMEDLIEAVVGEIDDEYDEAPPASVVARPGGVFDADGRAALEDLEAALETALAPADLEEQIDTVAGLLGALAGRVPQRGEVIAHPAGWEFEITDADPRRVKRVKARRVEPAEPAPDATAK